MSSYPINFGILSQVFPNFNIKHFLNSDRKQVICMLHLVEDMLEMGEETWEIEGTVRFVAQGSIGLVLLRLGICANAPNGLQSLVCIYGLYEYFFLAYPPGRRPFALAAMSRRRLSEFFDAMTTIGVPELCEEGFSSYEVVRHLYRTLSEHGYRHDVSRAIAHINYLEQKAVRGKRFGDRKDKLN